MKPKTTTPHPFPKDARHPQSATGLNNQNPIVRTNRSEPPYPADANTRKQIEERASYRP